MAHDVGLHIGIGVHQRVSYAGLCGEMEDVGDAGCCARDRLDGGPVGDVGAVQGETRAGEACGTGLLQRRVVVRVEVVDADHGGARGHQAFGNMVSHEPCRTG